MKVVGGALLAACLSLAGSAQGADSRVAVGFSNLVARLDSDEIGFAKPEYRVHILEALRGAGFNAVGAESLVFGKDEAERADLVLGGTVTELDCKRLHRQLRCSVGVEWQLLDRERDEIVYRVLTRYAGLNLPQDNDVRLGRALTLGALQSLMKRERFKKLLTVERSVAPEEASYPAATYADCSAEARELPTDFETIAAGAVIVKSGGGTGSGFALSSDGLIMTAAHVVASGRPEVRTRDGKTFPARVVRVSNKHDVALLSLGSSVSLACLSLEPAEQTPGSDVFAIGSPGGEVLGFSLSRGIVSGVRIIDEVPLLQTDASISPGNSGGPLVDRQGRVVGVVSRKIAGHAVEGLGFAIPIRAGLAALALAPGAATEASLRQAPAPIAAGGPKPIVDDRPDAPVSLDPEGDRSRALEADYARRVREQNDRTPGYVKPMRWLGLGFGIVGGLTLTATYLQLKADSSLTKAEYQSLRWKNDLGWAGAVVGFGAFTASYLLVPKLGPPGVARAPRWFVAGGPSKVSLNVSFQ